jgi:hypothetical protein
MDGTGRYIIEDKKRDFSSGVRIRPMGVFTLAEDKAGLAFNKAFVDGDTIVVAGCEGGTDDDVFWETGGKGVAGGGEEGLGLIHGELEGDGICQHDAFLDTPGIGTVPDTVKHEVGQARRTGGL